MGRIKVGNSGWSYTDWIGSFYPRGSKADRFLSAYFDIFETVEVNSTFYRMPEKKTVENWADEANNHGKREFCVKVPQDITHYACMEEDPDKMREKYSEFSERVLEVLDEKGTLGAVLFQASPYFTMRGDIKYRMKSEPRVPPPDYTMGLERLKDICFMMAEHPGERALELRNSSWLDEDSNIVESASSVLRNTGTALVTVDGPSFPWIDTDTSRHNYIRFHGRNKQGWFKEFQNDPSARYRYKYTKDELKERVDPIKIMAAKVDKDTRVFFNNHPQGYAPQNAIDIMEMLGVERPTGSIDRFW